MSARTRNLVIAVAALLVAFAAGGTSAWLVIGARHAPPQLLAAAGDQRAPVPSRAEVPTSFAAVAKAVNPAVVNIDTIVYERPAPDLFSQFFGASPFSEEPVPAAGLGSGFIVRKDGLVLTNQHVIADASKITVTLADGRRLPGSLLAADQISDIALVRVKADNLPIAQLGDSDAIQQGDWAIAIGNPFGFMHTVTVGVISALGRPITLSDEGKRYEDLIQTDAYINSGNSGGPLCAADGKVIGINTMIFAAGQVPAPIGFAIPINNAKRVMNELLQYGRVIRSWTGAVFSTTVTPGLARQYDLPFNHGVLIRGVVRAGPAEQAGLQRGDVITEMDGKPVTSRDDLLASIRAAKVGSTLRFEAWRATNQKWTQFSLTVVTAEEPAGATGA
jgi:serine protease Do